MRNDSNSPTQQVGHQTAVSGTWMVGARIISRLVDLGTMSVLARVLRPQDFGVVAIAMTIIYILETCLEMPVSQALVRLENLTRAHYDTAFTLSALRGLVLTVVVCGLSVPFSLVYGDPRIRPLVCLLGLAPAARGLVSPCMTAFVRSLNFSREFSIELIGKVLAFGASISIALIFHNYWAIAVGTIVAPAASTLASYVLAPYRPRFSLAELRSFTGFLGWITVAQFISAVNWQSDRLLLGKLTSQSQLGLFTAANDVSNVPLMTLMGPSLRPLLSAFSLIRHNSERLRKSYQSSSTAMVTMGLPILVGQSLIAEEVVRLMFGPRWGGAVPMLRWLAVSLIPSLFAMPFGPLVMSLNRTETFVKRNTLEIVVKLPLVIVGALEYRFMGVIFARVISEVVTVAFCMVLVRKLIQLPIMEQLIAPWRAIASCVAMGAAVEFVKFRLISFQGSTAVFESTVLLVLTGAVVYASVLLLLWVVSGCPAGIEAMVMTKTANLFRRSPAPVEQLR